MDTDIVAATPADFTISRIIDSQNIAVSGPQGSRFRVVNAEPDEIKIYLFDKNLSYVSGTNALEFAGYISVRGYGEVTLAIEASGLAPLVCRAGYLPTSGGIRTAIASKINTVFFHANGGSGVMPAQTAGIETHLTANAFTRVGYAFMGWNTKADGSGRQYSNRETFPFDDDTFLYAQWDSNDNPDVVWEIDATESGPRQGLSMFRFLGSATAASIRRGFTGE